MKYDDLQTLKYDDLQTLLESFTYFCSYMIITLRHEFSEMADDVQLVDHGAQGFQFWPHILRPC